MQFGAVFQTNPPASRFVQLAQLAEVHGFSHVWSFDSHVLWQEPYVILSAALAATALIIFSAQSSASQNQLLPQLSLDFWDLVILAVTPIAAGLAARLAAGGTVNHALKAVL